MSETRQRSRSHKRFRRRFGLVILLSSIAFGSGIGFLVGRDFYSVKTIEVRSTHKTENLRGLSDLYNVFLPTLSEDRAEKKLLQLNPTVASVDVKKEYPGKLDIAVKTLLPVAFIMADDEYIVLAPNARVLSKDKNRPTQLPELVHYQKMLKNQVAIGDTLSFLDITNALFFQSLSQQNGLTVLKVDIEGFHMIRLLLEDSREILVTTEKNRDTQAYQLKAILRQFKIEGRDFKTIDVRFDKPVVVFK